MLIPRLKYYLRSIPALFRGVGGKRMLLEALVRRRVNKPFLVSLKESGLRFRVRSGFDIWVIKEVCLEDSYGLSGLRPDRDPVFIDIGACFGAFAVQAAQAFPEGTVFAYEPSPDSARLLQENIELNGLSNVRVFPTAVAGRPGTTTLFLDAREAVRNSTSPPNRGAGLQALEVHSTSLEAIFARHDIESCDLLKMDCEGAEYEILFGASDATLRRVGRIALEYHDWVAPFKGADLARFLRRRGFRVRMTPNPAYPGIGSLAAEACAPAAPGGPTAAGGRAMGSATLIPVSPCLG